MGSLTVPNKLILENDKCLDYVAQAKAFAAEVVRLAELGNLYQLNLQRDLDDVRIVVAYINGQCFIRVQAHIPEDAEDKKPTLIPEVEFLVLTSDALLGYRTALRRLIIHRYNGSVFTPLAIDVHGYAYVGDFDSISKIHWLSSQVEWTQHQPVATEKYRWLSGTEVENDIPFLLYTNSCRLATINYAFVKIYDLAGTLVWRKLHTTAVGGTLEERKMLTFWASSTLNAGIKTYILSHVWQHDYRDPYYYIATELQLYTVEDTETEKIVLKSFEYEYDDSYSVSNGEYAGRILEWRSLQSWETYTLEVRIREGQHFNYIGYPVTSRTASGPNGTEIYRSEILVSDDFFKTFNTVDIPDYCLTDFQEFQENSILCLITPDLVNYFLQKIGLDGAPEWILPLDKPYIYLRVKDNLIYVLSWDNYITCFAERDGIVQQIKHEDIDIQDLQVIPSYTPDCQYEEGTEYELASQYIQRLTQKARS